MRNIFIPLVCILLTLILLSCSDKDRTAELPGMYVGNLCCNTAIGLVSHITFEKSGRIAATVTDYDDEQVNVTAYGIWQSEKGIIRMNVAGNYFYCKQLSADEIVITDKSGHPKERGGKLCLLYREAGKVATDFSGIYTLDGCEEEGYLQTLHLKPISGDSLEVNISFTGAIKGCEFKGIGCIINNQIEVNLSDYGSHIASTMVLNVLENNQISVITSRYEDRFDLMFFCGGGGSLGGYYLKEN